MKGATYHLVYRKHYPIDTEAVFSVLKPSAKGLALMQVQYKW